MFRMCAKSTSVFVLVSVIVVPLKVSLETQNDRKSRTMGNILRLYGILGSSLLFFVGMVFVQSSHNSDAERWNKAAKYLLTLVTYVRATHEFPSLRRFDQRCSKFYSFISSSVAMILLHTTLLIVLLLSHSFKFLFLRYWGQKPA